MSGYGDGAIKLTDDEIPELFGDLPIAGYALFDEKDGRVLEIEGSYGKGKLLIAAPGIDTRDAVIEGGNAVTYYAEFKLGENTVYIENAGNMDESGRIRMPLAEDGGAGG